MNESERLEERIQFFQKKIKELEDRGIRTDLCSYGEILKELLYIKNGGKIN